MHLSHFPHVTADIPTRSAISLLVPSHQKGRAAVPSPMADAVGNYLSRILDKIVQITTIEGMKITSQEEYGVRCLLRLARVHGEQSLTIPEIAVAERMRRAPAAQAPAGAEKEGGP